MFHPSIEFDHNVLINPIYYQYSCHLFIHSLLSYLIQVIVCYSNQLVRYTVNVHIFALGFVLKKRGFRQVYMSEKKDSQ